MSLREDIKAEELDHFERKRRDLSGRESCTYSCKQDAQKEDEIEEICGYCGNSFTDGLLAKKNARIKKLETALLQIRLRVKSKWILDATQEALKGD